MDIKAYNVFKEKENFWFKAKKGLIDVLLSNTKKSNLKILSIGVGTGEELEVLNRYGQVYVVDIDEKALKVVPDSLCIEKKLCDACNLDYPNNFFDLVVSFDVFEHIETDKSAVSECYRVLNGGGRLILTVPAHQVLYSAHDKALGHKRRYSKKSLYRLLKNFEKVKLGYWNFFLFVPFAVKRIIEKNKKPKTDYVVLPELLNKSLYYLLAFENKLIKKGVPLFVGLTLFGIVQKKK